MNQHGKELTRTEGNSLIETTNQGVACSNHAGCTIKIKKLSATLNRPSCLAHTFAHKFGGKTFALTATA